MVLKNKLFLTKLLLVLNTLAVFNSVQSFSVTDTIAAVLNYTFTTAKNNPILIASSFALPAGLYTAAYMKQRAHYHRLYWNWDPKVRDINTLSFPRDFLFGAGSAAHQVDENCNNNTWSKDVYYLHKPRADGPLLVTKDELENEWSLQQKNFIKTFEQKQGRKPSQTELDEIYQKEFVFTLAQKKQEEFDKEWEKQKPTFIAHFIKENRREPTQEELDTFKTENYTFCFAGDACMGQEHYKEDVQLLKKLGCKAYRFSVEWSKIMPTEDTFDPKALQYYINLCDELNKNGIKPVITLYHYTEPIWFAKKGGFEKKENIQFFIQFCDTILRTLGRRVHLYFTFNSPIGGFALNSYHQGNRPPFKKDIKTTFEVIKNILDAHVAVYKVKQAIDPELRVGILKNIHQLDPARAWHPVDQLVCSIGNKIQDDPFYQFFTTGKINMEFPFGLKGLAGYVPGLNKKYVSFTHENPDATKSLDFIGVNYYGHRYMKGTQSLFDPREERCGTPGKYNPTYTMYPEGLYRALVTVNEKLVTPLKKRGRNIPIYVTENGIGTDDNDQRKRFMAQYLYALSKAIQDGINVCGYFCWALLDNYEWGKYSRHYGLYAVNHETQERTLKPGALHYRDVMLAYAQAAQTKRTEKSNNVTVTILENAHSAEEEKRQEETYATKEEFG